jgi:DNA-3-methyladenine glycosylase II
MHTAAETYLSKKDKHLKKLIAKHGPCKIKPHSKYFVSLCDAIISQQLSVKASATIERRFHELFSKGQATPKETIQYSAEQLRSVGVSNQKAKYLISLAEHFLDGTINPLQLKRLSDEEIIAALTAVKGIGKWTAEMFLIFTLGRPDVFSVGDLGLRNAVKKLYNIHTHNEIEEFAERWKPHRSVASWYLWRSLENE